MTNRSVRKDQPLALVVGACGGMGLACARRLGQQYRLILADINAPQLRVDAEALAEEGISTLPVACDVTDDDSVAALSGQAHAGRTCDRFLITLSPI